MPKMGILSYGVLFVLLLFSLTHAQPPWITRQRLHSLAPFSPSASQNVCRMTNLTQINQLLAPILVPRVVGTANHKKVGMYLKRTLDDLGMTTEWDRFNDRTPYGSKTFRNLIATFDPVAPRRLVLACHYDSKYENYDFIGATDSALPCALLLDIATTLAPYVNTGSNKDLTLQLIFFDGEEAFVRWTDTDSIYGARHLADAWLKKWYPSVDQHSRFYLNKELDRMDVMVLLDLLGAANPKIQNHNGLGAENMFSELTRIEETLKGGQCLKSIPKIFYDQNTYSGVMDDHIPFLNQGVRILHLIPVPFPRVWHNAGDDASALDQDTIHNLASIIRVFVARYLGLSVPA